MFYIIYAQKLKEPEVNTVDLFLVNLTCWVLLELDLLYKRPQTLGQPIYVCSKY